MMATFRTNEDMAFRVAMRRAAEAGGYWAVCDMPGGGCTVQGATLQETQKNMLEAVEMYLEDNPGVVDYWLLFEVESA
jgi:predicted RNase H-like HicB family nuclease